MQMRCTCGSPTKAYAWVQHRLRTVILISAIVSAATITGADAVHPGYGFLSEEASFASILEEHGFTFIGPSAEHIKLMGDKVAAKAAVEENGVPVVPGSKGALETAADARRSADQIGYPVLIKGRRRRRTWCRTQG